MPTDFSTTLLEAQKTFGGMRTVAQIVPTPTGEPIEWPTVDATSQMGEILDENATATSQDVAFGVKNMGAFKYSSKALAAPFELLQDSRIDLQAYIVKLLAKRIARITNMHFTIGSGDKQPTGVLTSAALGVQGAAGQVDNLTYDNFLDLEHSIDPAYRTEPSCVYMFNDSTLRVIRKLKDGNGRPIWLPAATGNAQNTAPDLINGYRYVINQDMPSLGANNKPILFGDFNNYLIRDVMQVTLFRMSDSAFTMKGQVGFIALSRHDGNLIAADNTSIRYFQNAAA